MFVSIITYYADGATEKNVMSFKSFKEAEKRVETMNQAGDSFDPVYKIDNELDEKGVKEYIDDEIKDAVLNGAAEVNWRVLRTMRDFMKEYGYYPSDFQSEKNLKETENHNLNVYKGWE